VSARKGSTSSRRRLEYPAVTVTVGTLPSRAKLPPGQAP
jgi:hypothetical protein